MEPSLIQHQTQRLVLSPQIRQYLRLLQLPMTELQQAVELELTANPTLDETREKTADEISDSPDLNTSPSEPTAEELRLGESFDNLARLDESFQEGYQQDVSFDHSEDAEKRRNFKQNSISKAEGLTEYMLWQTRFLDITATQKIIIEEIVGNLDDNGYLRATTEEISNSLQLPIDEVEKTLLIVQNFDPDGVAARSLQETLLIQLRKKGLSDHLAFQIVDQHFGLLEKRDWKQITKELNASHKDVEKAAEIIKGLDPHPGRHLKSDESLAVTPDATVTFSENSSEKLKVEIHDEMVPDLRISRYYRKLLRTKTTDPKTKAFLREKIQSGINFIRALNLRKSTIREITEELIKLQPLFFEKGFSHLKPLRLKDIADRLGIHESTVSRALQGKYIATPQGVIPYKSFFSSKLETAHGEDESQKSIMQKIRHLVDKENPKKPLSDQEIVKLLRNDGVMIARRTIAKYRDILKILPSHLRRQR